MEVPISGASPQLGTRWLTTEGSGLMIGLLIAAMAARVDLRITEHVDPITDARQIYAIVGTPQHYLALGCDSDRDHAINVVVHFKQYIGESSPGILLGGTDVQYRFDQQPPAAVRWFSHDHQVSASTSPTKPVRFALEMKGTRSVYVRAICPGEDPVDARFEYEDATPMIETMLGKCGLNPDGSDPAKPPKQH